MGTWLCVLRAGTEHIVLCQGSRSCSSGVFPGVLNGQFGGQLRLITVFGTGKKMRRIRTILPYIDKIRQQESNIAAVTACRDGHRFAPCPTGQFGFRSPDRELTADNDHPFRTGNIQVINKFPGFNIGLQLRKQLVCTE